MVDEIQLFSGHAEDIRTEEERESFKRMVEMPAQEEVMAAMYVAEPRAPSLTYHAFSQ